MKQAKNTIIIIIWCLLSFISGVLINELKAETTKIPEVQNINNITGCGYEKMYIDGQYYIIFHNASYSDIEVVRKP